MKKGISIASVLALVISVFSMGSMMAAAEAPAAGYAAVGQVKDSIAAVLFGDGTKAEVSFTGTAPVSGAVYAYSKTGDAYTFTTVEVNGNQSQQLSNEKPVGTADTAVPGAWSLYFWPWQGFNDQNSATHRLTDNASIFIRYSATIWRLVDRSENEFTNNGLTTGYFHDNGELGSDNLPFTDMVVVGAIDEDGSTILTPSKEKTAIFDKASPKVGWDIDDDANVTLTLSTSIPTQPENPTTPPTEAGPKLIDIGQSGTCAVGLVKDGTAYVLTEKNQYGAVKVSGTAPVSGDLCSYKKEADGYLFTSVVFDEGAGLSLSAVKDEAWTARTLNSEDDRADQLFLYDTTNEKNIYLDCTPETKVFIRYSATDWRLVTCKTTQDLLHSSGWDVSHLYYISTKAGATADVPRQVNYVVVGSFKDNAVVPAVKTATSYFDKAGSGWDAGNIKLDGSMSLADSSNPNPGTGAALPMMVIVAGLTSAGVLAVVSRKGKRYGKAA